MKVYYLMECGQHVTDTHAMSVWIEFFNRHKS
jgi:hypothetical protein